MNRNGVPVHKLNTDVITDLQKVIKIGNSYGVILPKRVRELLGLKQGDTVVLIAVKSSNDSYLILTKP